MNRYYERGELVWIAPGAVRYDLADTGFLLPWLYDMREGAYPSEPSGYTEGRSSGSTTRAYYETVCEVAAELDDRLARTGKDRYLVEDFYCGTWGEATEEEILNSISRSVNLPAWEVRRSIGNALSYISSGSCHRWVACIDCLKYPRCRKKKKGRRPVDYAEWCRRRNRRENRNAVVK